MVGGRGGVAFRRRLAGDHDAGPRRGLWRGRAGFGAAGDHGRPAEPSAHADILEGLWAGRHTLRLRRRRAAGDRRFRESAQSLRHQPHGPDRRRGRPRRPGLPGASTDQGSCRPRADRQHRARQRPLADRIGDEFRDDRLSCRRRLRVEGDADTCSPATCSSASRWCRCSTAASGSAWASTTNSTFSPRNCRTPLPPRAAAERTAFRPARLPRHGESPACKSDGGFVEVVAGRQADPAGTHLRQPCCRPGRQSPTSRHRHREAGRRGRPKARLPAEA